MTGQSPTSLKSLRIVADEHRFEPHLGRDALFIHQGMAIVPDDLTDGLIECDIAIPRSRSFTGLVWRLADEHNYEHFYLRPHQNGNPDATQYTPVWNGISAWQLYHGEPYQMAITFPIEEWVRVAVMFHGSFADVRVGDTTLPPVRLRRPVAAGKVALYSGTGGAYFSALHVSEIAPAAATPDPTTPAPGTVRVWDVGGRAVRAEPSGLTNLASIWNGEGDTMTARVIVLSDRAQTKRVDFGFANHARVALNGVDLYEGHDAYRSRDYRFLGSIGWYDTVFLPLREGRNELSFAVTGAGGGWGVQARFPDMEGIALGDAS